MWRFVFTGANGGLQGTGTGTAAGAAGSIGAHAANAPGAGARAAVSNGGVLIGSSVPEGEGRGESCDWWQACVFDCTHT